MKKSTTIHPVEGIANLILLIREKRVLIDSDLGRLYDVQTKALNQAVKRNSGRFPEDFMFSLNEREKIELVTNCDRFKRLKHSSSLPNAFTEHGALMLASVLNSQKAVDTSIYVIRAFVRLRELLTTNETLFRKLADLERKIARHDADIISIVQAIRQLTEVPPVRPTQRIGFIVDEPTTPYRTRKKRV